MKLESEIKVEKPYSHRSIVGRVIFGGLCVFGFVIIWMVPGVLFNGSVSQVHSLCSAGFLSGSSSCSDANTAQAVAFLMLGAGVISFILSAVRWNHNSRLAEKT
jgi:hypothetical protein